MNFYMSSLSKVALRVVSSIEDAAEEGTVEIGAGSIRIHCDGQVSGFNNACLSGDGIHLAVQRLFKTEPRPGRKNVSIMVSAPNFGETSLPSAPQLTNYSPKTMQHRLFSVNQAMRDELVSMTCDSIYPSKKKQTCMFGRHHERGHGIQDKGQLSSHAGCVCIVYAYIVLIATPI